MDTVTIVSHTNICILGDELTEFVSGDSTNRWINNNIDDGIRRCAS
jgi:hypothetical protein